MKKLIKRIFRGKYYKNGESYVDPIVKVIICVVVGTLLLTSVYAVAKSGLESAKNKVNGLLDYNPNGEDGPGGGDTSIPDGEDGPGGGDTSIPDGEDGPGGGDTSIPDGEDGPGGGDTSIPDGEDGPGGGDTSIPDGEDGPGGGGFSVQLPAATTLRIYYHWVNNFWEDANCDVYIYETNTLGYVTTQPSSHIWNGTINAPAGETVDGYIDVPLTGFLGSYWYTYLVIAIQNSPDHQTLSVPVIFHGTANSVVSGPTSGISMLEPHRTAGTPCAYRTYAVYNPGNPGGTSTWATNKSFDCFYNLRLDDAMAIYIDGYSED